MSLVTINVNYTSGSVNTLVSEKQGLFDILYALEKSENIKSFNTIIDYPIGPDYFGYGKSWVKWITPTKVKTQTLYVLLVKREDVPKNIILGDMWKQNGDDFCISSLNKGNVESVVRRLGEDVKFLVKEYEVEVDADFKTNDNENNKPNQVVVLVQKATLDKHVKITNNHSWKKASGFTGHSWMSSFPMDSIEYNNPLIEELRLSNVPFIIESADRFY